MIFDWDDFTEDNNRLDLLQILKDLRPDFVCTVFAIPAKCSPGFLATVPEWIEVAMHGWEHGDPPTDGGECKDWTWNRTIEALICRPDRFAKGFKAPGWQISDDALGALAMAGWWVADQPYNDDRRPAGLYVHRLGDGDHWHGHIQNVCGNGLEETFAQVMGFARSANSFEFMSEVVKPWVPGSASSSQRSGAAI